MVVGAAEVVGAGPAEAVEEAVGGDVDRPTGKVDVDGEAERLDSKLRGVIEVYDAQGKRMAVSRTAMVSALVSPLVFEGFSEFIEDFYIS